MVLHTHTPPHTNTHTNTHLFVCDFTLIFILLNLHSFCGGLQSHKDSKLKKTQCFMIMISYGDIETRILELDFHISSLSTK